MSTTKRYGVISNEGAQPYEFELFDNQGRSVGTFHVTAKPRLDLAQAMARAVSLVGGNRVYEADILTYCLRELLIKERWDGEAWVAADDRGRMDEILTSDRVMIPIETLAQIVMDLLAETTGHPTGGSGPSSAGPTTIDTTSKDDSALPV